MDNYRMELVHDKYDENYIESMYAQADVIAKENADNPDRWIGVWINRWNRAVDDLKCVAEARYNWRSVHSMEREIKRCERFKGLGPSWEMNSKAMERHIFPETSYGLAGILEDLKKENADIASRVIKTMWNSKPWTYRTSDFIRLEDHHSDDGQVYLTVGVLGRNYTMFLMLAVMEGIIKQQGA